MAYRYSPEFDPSSGTSLIMGAGDRALGGLSYLAEMQSQAADSRRADLAASLEMQRMGRESELGMQKFLLEAASERRRENTEAARNFVELQKMQSEQRLTDLAMLERQDEVTRKLGQRKNETDPRYSTLLDRVFGNTDAMTKQAAITELSSFGGPRLFTEDTQARLREISDGLSSANGVVRGRLVPLSELDQYAESDNAMLRGIHVATRLSAGSNETEILSRPRSRITEADLAFGRQLMAGGYVGLKGTMTQQDLNDISMSYKRYRRAEKLYNDVFIDKTVAPSPGTNQDEMRMSVDEARDDYETRLGGFAGVSGTPENALLLGELPSPGESVVQATQSMLDAGSRVAVPPVVEQQTGAYLAELKQLVDSGEPPGPEQLKDLSSKYPLSAGSIVENQKAVLEAAMKYDKLRPGMFSADPDVHGPAAEALEEYQRSLSALWSLNLARGGQPVPASALVGREEALFPLKVREATEKQASRARALLSNPRTVDSARELDWPSPPGEHETTTSLGDAVSVANRFMADTGSDEPLSRSQSELNRYVGELVKLADSKPQYGLSLSKDPETGKDMLVFRNERKVVGGSLGYAWSLPGQFGSDVVVEPQEAAKRVYEYYSGTSSLWAPAEAREISWSDAVDRMFSMRHDNIHTSLGGVVGFDKVFYPSDGDQSSADAAANVADTGASSAFWSRFAAPGYNLLWAPEVPFSLNKAGEPLSSSPVALAGGLWAARATIASSGGAIPADMAATAAAAASGATAAAGTTAAAAPAAAVSGGSVFNSAAVNLAKAAAKKLSKLGVTTLLKRGAGGALDLTVGWGATLAGQELVDTFYGDGVRKRHAEKSVYPIYGERSLAMVDVDNAVVSRLAASSKSDVPRNQAFALLDALEVAKRGYETGLKYRVVRREERDSLSPSPVILNALAQRGELSVPGLLKVRDSLVRGSGDEIYDTVEANIQTRFPNSDKATLLQELLDLVSESVGQPKLKLGTPRKSTQEQMDKITGVTTGGTGGL